MRMTGRFLAAMVLLAMAASAAGCGSSPPPRPMPAVTGSFGSDPVITMPNGSPPGRLVVRTLIQGHGPVVRPHDYVLFNVQGKVWAGNREVVDSYTNHSPQGLPLASALPAWRSLAGQRTGSRVLMVVPPKDAFGSKGDPQANIMGSDTLVFVFDVLGSLRGNAHATGTVIPYHPGPDMPSVAWTSHGPKITVPSRATPPAKLVRQVLIRGKGQPLQASQTVVAQEIGVVWRTGKVFDSTWSRGFPESFLLGAGQVIPGLDNGIGGLPVGSRVLLVVPPALGYGQAGHAPYVGSHDSLVFIVDIVAAT
jgi:FKBP-type peptidyl-prolyl cis-trans isomerase